MTRDGVEIKLLLNAGLLLDLAQLHATGAAGVGLFRTEIPLLARNAFPDVAEQTAFYRRAYEQAGERPIVFRTLDIGGDKVLPYLAARPPRTTRRWAGARSASGSTGRRCCGSNCGRCCAPPAAATCTSSFR